MINKELLEKLDKDTLVLLAQILLEQSGYEDEQSIEILIKLNNVKER